MKRSRIEREKEKLETSTKVTNEDQPKMEARQNLPPTAGPPGFAFLDDQRIRQFKERTFTLLEKHGVFYLP